MTPEELLESAQALNQRGERYAMVTVVRTTPPTSAYVGAQAIVLADGSLQGSVGGGCAREVVVAAALEAMHSGAARLVLISNASQDGVDTGVERHAMRCASNGEIELFIHPHLPAPLLLVLGSTPAAVQARSFARDCAFRVTECAQGADAAQIAIALVATQGEDDENALHAALASSARTVLLVASRRKAERLRDAMRLRGVGEARLAAIEAPAGPDIGAHSPAHIALAAVAGAVACWQKMTEKAQEAAPAQVRPEPAAPVYVNPVCGAAVAPGEALHVVSYAGMEFYFCCDGCKLEFDRDPARYAAIQAGRPLPASMEAA
jgi:xanthine dehydrogenase accessory factor